MQKTIRAEAGLLASARIVFFGIWLKSKDGYHQMSVLRADAGNRIVLVLLRVRVGQQFIGDIVLFEIISIISRRGASTIRCAPLMALLYAR